MSRHHRLRALSVLACVLFSACQGSDVAPLVGLAARPSNSTCLAPPRPSNFDAKLERAYPGLSFSSPLVLRQRPGDNARWYVGEKGGVIYVFDNNDAETDKSVFLDLSNGFDLVTTSEAGLLSFAFHPDYPDTAEVFVTYVRNKAGGGLEEVLSRFTSSDMGATLDEGSEEELVAVDEPLASHNGGDLHFDSGGLLYWSLGDGGFASSTQPNGQDTSNILGSLLRLDPDGDDDPMAGGCDMPYGIPAGNPFEDAACPTGGADDVRLIYAWGFRNPWRFSLDADTGAHQDEIWLGDVGQGDWEEVNRVQLGGNYGWAVKEGFECFNADTCDDSGMTDPVHVYDHQQGVAITGGYVYRGSEVTDFAGEDVYLFTDFGGNAVWAMFDAYGTPEVIEAFATGGRRFAAFGEDVMTREIYLADIAGGGIYRISYSDTPNTGTFPTLLSESGCVDENSPLEPAPGVIPYEINAPFWTDGAEKQRFIAIPDNSQISVEDNGDWTFPIGTVIMKHFFLNDRPIETRLLIRHDDGEWNGYSYEWRDPPTDADLLPSEGVEKTVESQTWLYPSRSNCTTCHGGGVGVPLGPKNQQIDKMVHYSEGVTANQLSTFEWIGLLDRHVPVTPMVDPTDTSRDLTLRARSWLDTNCSQCHNPNGTAAMMDLRFETPLAQTETCGEDVTFPLGPGVKRLDPGDASNSGIFIRPTSLDSNVRMPPLGTYIVDEVGTDLIESWIDSLSACP